jgi:hypothetical protein
MVTREHIFVIGFCGQYMSVFLTQNLQVLLMQLGSILCIVESMNQTSKTASLLVETYCRTYVWRLYIWQVLDWQLDLLDHTQLQCIHVTIHYCSCNSSGIPCHHLLTLFNRTVALTLNSLLAAGLPYIACEQTAKKTPTVALAVVASEQTS